MNPLLTMKLLNSFFTLLSEKCSDGGYSVATVSLNPEHVIFKAHFPGHPVTPGVCIIAMVTEVLEHMKHRNLIVKTVKNLKFVNIISPLLARDVEIVFQSIDEDDVALKSKGLLRDGDLILTKFSIIFQIVD